MKPLDISVESNGVVILTLQGSLSGEETMEALKKTIKACSDIIEDLYKGEGKKLRVLIDMTAFSGEYEIQAMHYMNEFGKRHASHIEKSVMLSGTVKTDEMGLAMTDQQAKKFVEHERESALAFLE